MSPSRLVAMSGLFSLYTIPKSTTEATVLSGSAVTPWQVSSSHANANSAL
jgi:hypothetical protein